MRNDSSRRSRQGISGFSLIELAIVLMIVGTLLSGVLIAVSRTTATARITSAKAQLREIEEALYGYAVAYGRLPCPTTPTAADPGYEEVGAVGECAEPHAFIPFATLGLTGPINGDGLLLDPWQNPIRYSVASYQHPGSGNYSFTNTPSATAGIKQLFNAADMADFVNAVGMLRVCNNPACTEIVYVNSAPAVVLSMGANWATYTSANEQQNAGDGTTTLAGTNTYNVTNSDDFVMTTYSEENFDDEIIWVSPYVLFNRLVSAGKLP